VWTVPQLTEGSWEAQTIPTGKVPNACVSRCSWSADGQLLAVPSCAKDLKPVALSFVREIWTPQQFVGHTFATTVAVCSALPCFVCN